MQFKYDRLIAVSMGALVIASASAYALHQQRSTAMPAASSEASSETAVERFKIPAIGVDAAIERVALAPDGAMDTPDSPHTVGWYSPGPYPGEQGSAVIAGHRGWKDGVAAVFDDLDKVQVGDELIVIDSEGKERSFIVRETRVYPRDTIAPEVFLPSDGTHLNLITCVGDWDGWLQSSTERLVVFADLAG